MPNAIFIYTGKTVLSAKQRTALEDAGYTVLRVHDMNDIKIMNDNPLDNKERLLYSAAMHTLAHVEFDSVKADFARTVVKKITNCSQY